MNLKVESYLAQAGRWPQSGRYILARYAGEWLLEVQDISDFVRQQQANATAPYARLSTPKEEVYPVAVRQ